MPSKKVGRPSQRTLPEKRNPLLAVAEAPDHAELVRRRRLGQTKLEVPPTQVGMNNATKPEYLGIFDYAHLRAPLPKDLKGSEIFAPQQHQHPPTSYFLMRRSSDGFVSATGMFKAAFPWATHAEELAEKEYVRDLTDAALDEIAGNVWISEHLAIQLADEYGIVAWVAALLDPAVVLAGEGETAGQSISPPPKFKFTAGDKAHLPAPNGAPRGSTPKSRGRPRGSSPAKSTSPVKSSAKKPRETKKQKEANAAAAKEASASLQATLNDAVAATQDAQPNGDTVKVDVETTVEAQGNTETTTTNVRIEMPQGSAELPLPEKPEQMIETAKKMVDEAKKLEKSSGPSKSKRKADELDVDDEVVAGESQPAKRARLAEQRLKRERVRNRALVGVVFTIAAGALIPYFT